MHYLVKLRYYPGDPLREIREEDLQGISEKWGLGIGVEEVKGAVKEGQEETLDKDLEEITQIVITVVADRVSSLRRGLKDLIKRYRAPRTVYALWGSNPAGEDIAREIIEEMDGWR
ncbi:MAG: hypothetical protein JSW32_00155 [Deltaproteobacteria bacterium]|nr:MAG: hypothetical protein JSW32_00155 [Deltaproteobacteria bacterium]